MAGDLHSYLSEMLVAARSKSGDALLLHNIDQIVAQAGERGAEVLRRAAVPRWIDAGVLRVLREKDEGNERVVEKLLGYSFVRDLGDGRLAYHDEVRNAFLEEWRRERPEELEGLHRRLYQYFSQRTTPPGSSRRAMQLMPESELLSVVPVSHQSDLLRREAIYHLLCLDQDQGLDELRRSFAALEEVHRTAEAELLLQTAGEAGLGPRGRRWTQYFRARVLQASFSLDAALEQLDKLAEIGDLEPALAAEMSRTRGEILAETGQWARATELYRQSLAHFRQTGNRREAADTMLLLGEAYQGLGISTGSWHEPETFANPALRAAHALWIWLLGLPFQLAILLLGPRSRPLPRAEHCARYQNWLLIRLYNTARAWFLEARDAFRQLGDAAGTLRAEQRLADILLLYGYAGEAQAAVEALLKRPEARDPYRRAWLQRSLAECRLAAGDHAQAQALLREALLVFSELGDVRREAVVRYLQGRAAVVAGEPDAAIASYIVGLERFRTLRYAAARERILHELRVWKRRRETPPAVAARLEAIVAAEPEKRYVGRFIRTYLGLLQVVTVVAVPLALLLMAAAAPISSLTRSGAGTISLGIFFDPARVFGVALTLTPIYLAVYAAIATAVIFWLPISRIEREQPDVIITTPEGIARYDGKGTLELRQSWASVRRLVVMDRLLLRRPLALYSRTYLEDDAGRDLAIDGITGWYTELQGDVARHVAAAGRDVRREDLGYSLLGSGWGASLIAGVLLLVLVTWSNNDWLNLGGLFPPPVAGALWFLGLSGALMLVPLAYWIAARPLSVQRTLQLNERWPLVLAVLGAAPAAAYLAGGLGLLRVNALGFALFVWGVYVMAEALMALAAPRNRALRVGVVAAATILALAFVARPAAAHFSWLESYVARQQVQEGVASAAPNCAAAAQARALGTGASDTYLIQGDCAAQVGDWALAAEFYARAAANTLPGSGEQALAYYNLSVAAEALGDTRRADSARAEYQAICADSPAAAPICTTLILYGRQ